MPRTSSAAQLLDATALERLRLRRSPFGSASSDGIFSDAAHKTQINVALHMLQASDRLLVVRGEAGVGKSTFFAGLAGKEIPELVFVRLSAESEMDILGLCSRFLSVLGLELSGELSSVRFLNRLWDLGSSGRRPVLLLDDAEGLDPAVLDKLVALWETACADGTPFGLVLAVERSFDARLEQLTRQVLSPEQLHIINLFPFSERQTSDYLDYRIEAAGGLPTLLGEADRRQIHVRSKGVPARVNEEAERVLIAKANPRRLLPAWKRPVSAGHIAAGVSAVVLIAAGTLYSQLGTQGAADEVAELAIPPMTTSAPYGLPRPSDTSPRATQPAPAVEVQAAPVATETSVQPEVIAANTTDAPASDTPATAETELHAAVLNLTPVEIPQLEQPEVILAAADVEPGQPETEAAKSEAEAPSPEPVAQPEPEQPAQAPARAEPAPAPEPAPKPKPAAEPKPKAQPTPADGHAWLRTRPAKHYTIQVLAANERAPLVDFIAAENLRDTAAIIHTQRNGTDWFVLIIGDYRSHAAGTAASEKLPASTRRGGVWVRTFDSVMKVAVDK